MKHMTGIKVLYTRKGEMTFIVTDEESRILISQVFVQHPCCFQLCSK